MRARRNRPADVRPVHALIKRLHARLGDFWWYSLMLFCACRAADLTNAFVGLWLVPKYVDPKELGALLPLSQFANVLALPAAVFASTFRNELTTLAVNREFGKVKALMRGVFIATAAFLFLAIVISRLVLPLFLTRIRIVEGSLGWLILLSAFISCVAPVYSNAIQSLKRFRSYSLISLLGAPIRLVTMCLALPFRPVSGYFVGQTSTPLFSIAASVFCLRKELGGKAESYWSRAVVRRFARLFLTLTLGAVAGATTALVETTVLRQRLCDLDSAGYYMATRFSDIASFLALTLIFTLFPFTAELAAKGRDARPLVVKAALAVLGSNALLAALFGAFGGQVLSLLPHGAEYAAYGWVIPWMIAITTVNYLSSLYTTAETSANRFGFYRWMLPLQAAYALLLLLVTGYGHFAAFIPASWSAFLARNNVTTLSAMLWWMTAFGLVRLAFAAGAMLRKPPRAA